MQPLNYKIYGILPLIQPVCFIFLYWILCSFSKKKII